MLGRGSPAARTSLRLAALVALALGCGIVWVGASGAATTTVAPAKVRSLDDSCTGGRRVVGASVVGEAGDSSSGPTVALGSLTRPAARRAKGSAFNVGSAPGKLSVDARCASGPAPRSVSSSTTLPPAGMTFVVKSVSATCPAGKGIVFGGFRAEQRPDGDPDNPIVFPASAKRDGPRSWTVRGWNLSDGPDDAGELSSIAYCGNVGSTKAVSETKTIQPLTAASVKARCPRDSELAYGGYKASASENAVSVVTGLERVDDRTFRVSAAAPLLTPASPSVTAIAYCR